MASEFSRGEGIALLALLIAASLSVVLFALVLMHFRSLLRSLDLCLAGLLARNLFYALVTAPTLVSVAIGGWDWSLATCRLLVFSLHMPLIVSLIGSAFFAVDRMFLLRKDGGPIYNGWVTNKVKPLLLTSVWCCAAFVTGLVPVNLWTRVSTTDSGQQRCRFLPSQLDYSYSMVLCACNLACGVICAVCLLDGLLFLCERRRHPAQEAVAEAVAATNGSGAAAAKPHDSDQQSQSQQHQQQQQPEHLRRSAEFDSRKHAWESWRVTALAIGIIAFLNHLPLLILDFSTLVALRDGSASEYVFLILAESILLPNCLWIFALRYRHVVRRYFARLTRQPNMLDDRYCAMQMFQKRCTLMGSVYRGHRARSMHASSTYGSSPSTGYFGSMNGRLVRTRDGHPGVGGGGVGVANAGFDSASSYRTGTTLDRLTTLSTSSTLGFADYWEPQMAATQHQHQHQHQQQQQQQQFQQPQHHQHYSPREPAVPISSGEQVRAVVHATLDTLPEVDEEPSAWTAHEIGAGGGDVEEVDHIDAVIVNTVEMEPVGTAALGDYPDPEDDTDGFYLTEAELHQIASAREERQLRQLEELHHQHHQQQQLQQHQPSVVSVTDFRRPRRPDVSPFPRMYVNQLTRSVSGFSDDFGGGAAATASGSADSTGGHPVQGNNFSQELDSYL